MTLELLMTKDDFFDRCYKPFFLGGVKEITNQTEYGEDHFAITIFDRRVFYTDAFEYVKNADTDEYFIKDGKWIGDCND